MNKDKSFDGELIGVGRTHIVKVKDDKGGSPYIAQYEVRNGKVTVVNDTRYLENRCPHCGGRVIITSKGYFCENSLGKSPSCKFHCNGILSHRYIKPSEIDAYLGGKPVIIDGCFNSEGKIFSAILAESEKYGMTLTSVVGKYPGTDENVMVSPVAFNCASIGSSSEGGFRIWRRFKGYDITLQDLQELLTDGVTSHYAALNNPRGLRKMAYLRLSEDKRRVIADYETAEKELRELAESEKETA